MLSSLISQLPSPLSSVLESVGQSIGSTVANNIDAAALNPQPLPPKEIGDLFADSFDAVALNPQPLPPKEIEAIFEQSDLFPSVSAGPASTLFQETTGGLFAPEASPANMGLEDEFSDIFDEFQFEEAELPSAIEMPDPGAAPGTAIPFPDPSGILPFVPADHESQPGFEMLDASRLPAVEDLPQLRLNELIEPALMF